MAIAAAVAAECASTMNTGSMRSEPNAMCELEDQFDLGIMRILAHLELGRMTDIRSIFRAALDGKPSLEEATQIIDEIGGYMPALDLLQKTVSLAFPQVTEDAQASRPPPTATPLNGTGSSLIGSPPDAVKPRSGNRPSAKS